MANELAYGVLNFLGHHERTVDNIPEPIERNPFYMLEDLGILTKEKEEITLHDGWEWTIQCSFYRKERILVLIESKTTTIVEDIKQLLCMRFAHPRRMEK